MTETRTACEREHDFTLVLTGITELSRAAEDALFEAGCDDNTPSVRSGRVYLIFSRVAPSLKDAILSAIQNVRAANIGAEVLRVDDSNLVTQADIARRMKRSRQLVRQYITGERGPKGFPPPACHLCDDEAPLWYWCEAAHWLREHNLIEEEQARAAEEVYFINTVLGLRYPRALDPALADEVSKSIGTQGTLAS